jgi:hypothetical protein
MKWLVPCFLAAATIGCTVKTLPDPNDPTRVTANQAAVMRNQLRWASDAANERVFHHEISPDQAKQLVTQYAAQLSKAYDAKQLTAGNAWMYGEVLLSSQNWKLAEGALERAVKDAKDDDRHVNDSLRLAEVEAHLHKVDEAMRLVRGTFTVPNFAKAPILPAVLFTIVPAAKGQNHDPDLAQLLEECIQQHKETVVDPKIPAGKLFLLARPHHIRNAWEEVYKLYNESGHPDLAQKALKAAEQDFKPRFSA